MQKGIATLEVILAVLIIALLMKVAVPNATRLIDRAALDYETKRLYSELRFLQIDKVHGQASELSSCAWLRFERLRQVRPRGALSFLWRDDFFTKLKR